MPNHQVLIIEPQNELKFKGHFEQGFTTYMRLTNPTSDTVLFKIKTTAPKKYCVRPNSGSLEPNSKVDIAITPQPVCVDSNEKHKHKFMVQSVVAPEGKSNIDQVWKEISAEQMMDYKLKCVFDSPRGASINDSGDNVTQNDATKKRVVADEAKPAPTKEPIEVADKDFLTTSSSSSKTTNPKPESVGDGKTTSEDPQLREEERLRHENLQLKELIEMADKVYRSRYFLSTSSSSSKTEELLRMRVSTGPQARPPLRRHSYLQQKSSQAALMPWVAAVGMALLGFIIGKFLI